jgi:hypothetical protein
VPESEVGVSGRPWTADEDETLALNYANFPTYLIAHVLGRSERAVYQRAESRGLNKSADYLASDNAGRIQRGRTDPRMVGTQFKPGQSAWNKGTKGVVGVQPECRATQFRPGQMPKNHKPVGYERVNVDGYRERKVAEPKTFRAVHVLLWEEHLGPVPAGHAVIFKNRDKTDIRIDNLALVSRAALMRRNSYHNYPQPIPQLIQLRGALQRQINKRAQA